MKIQMIKKESISNKTYPFLGYILFGLFIVILIFSSHSQRKDNLVVDYILYATIVLIFLILIFIFIHPNKIKITTIGFIYMNGNEFILIENGVETRFALNSMQKLNLLYRGYKGEFFAFLYPTFLPADGTSNILSFEIDINKYKMELLLSNKYEKKELIKIIKKYNGKIKT